MPLTYKEITNIHIHTHRENKKHDALDLHEDRKNQKLFVIMGSYKSAVSKAIHEFYPSFKWQTSFRDHIIRDDKALANICQYIKQNPENWDEDLENEKYLSSITANERRKRLKQFYKNLAK